MNNETQNKLNELIDGLASDLKETVQKIEGRLATTRNHYGDYMALLSSIAKDKRTALIIGAALRKAGANPDGVADAIKAGYGE